LRNARKPHLHQADAIARRLSTHYPTFPNKPTLKSWQQQSINPTSLTAHTTNSHRFKKGTQFALHQPLSKHDHCPAFTNIRTMDTSTLQVVRRLALLIGPALVRRYRSPADRPNKLRNQS
jgi:hypothetical protein